MTLPKELPVPPVRLDGEVCVGPCCVCVFISVCLHLFRRARALRCRAYSRICEHPSCSVVGLKANWSARERRHKRAAHWLSKNTRLFSKTPKQWTSSSRGEMKTMADPQEKCSRLYVGAARVRYSRVGLFLTNMRHLSFPRSSADASWRNKTLLLCWNVSLQSCVSARVWERHQEKTKGGLIIYRFIIMNSSNCPSLQLPDGLKSDVFRADVLSLVHMGPRAQNSLFFCFLF